MSTSPRKQPTALLPIAMSFAALALAIGYVGLSGVVPHQDEGTPARIFQVLMVAQLPLVVPFAIKWLPRAPKHALLVLSVQVVAALAAIGTVLFLESR